MEETNVIEDFHGVYLLYCTNPKYKGRTYIGYTVDPSRRINQHNKGKRHGGAWKTSQRGPWDMVLIVHGFPNDISALRFEWAWQHPKVSRRLQHVPRKKTKENCFLYCLRILKEMLNVAPWIRLPLTIQWLKREYQRPLTEDSCVIPTHMSIVTGPVSVKTNKKTRSQTFDESYLNDTLSCCICFNPVSVRNHMTCTNNSPVCNMVSHIICLAKYFLNNPENSFTENSQLSLHHILPVEGYCPMCDKHLLWGELVKKKRSENS